MALVQLVSVSKHYGRHAAVDQVTLSVGGGEIVGLIGPNGAGKTTVLRLIAGLLRPTSGNVRLVPDIAREAIGYFGGEQTLPANVSARQWVALWNPEGAAATAPRRMGVLSRGTRQRVGLEAMTRADTKLLLLDEPWESLDPDASRWLSDTILQKRAAGAGVIVSSHRIHDLADVCDRCVFLVNGRLGAEIVAFADAGRRADRSAELFAAFDRARGRP
jgi:ABC-type multidrug transport system ATPase subunit